MRPRTASAAWRSEKPFGKLQDGDQGKPHGGGGGLAAGGEQVGELVVLVETSRAHRRLRM